MTGYQTRRAVESDLSRLYDIWYSDEIAGEEDTPAPGPPLSSLAYSLAHGDMRVAVDATGAIAGFGASHTWPAAGSHLTYLADLFVARDIQSRGAGQAILSALPMGEGARCVMASRDPRAAALYIRWGMLPRWPNYWLAADTPDVAHRLGGLPGDQLTITPADMADPELARWDGACCGFERLDDLRWLVESRDALPFWLARGGERLGYAFVQRRCPELLWRPQSWIIGPVGALAPEDAASCVGAITRFAAQRAPTLRLAVPGPHPTLSPLIEAGFLIVYLETFLASEGAPPFDPTRYLPSGVYL
jgi:acetyltransferase (GNAT) family protein